MSAECRYSYELEHLFVFIHRNKDIAGGLEDAGKTEGLLRDGRLHRARDTSILRRCASGVSPIHQPGPMPSISEGMGPGFKQVSL